MIASVDYTVTWYLVHWSRSEI